MKRNSKNKKNLQKNISFNNISGMKKNIFLLRHHDEEKMRCRRTFIIAVILGLLLFNPVFCKEEPQEEDDSDPLEEEKPERIFSGLFSPQ